MKADAKTETEVRSAIAALTDNYEKRNLACFAPDDDVILFGTGSTRSGSGPRRSGPR